MPEGTLSLAIGPCAHVHDGRSGLDVEALDVPGTFVPPTRNVRLNELVSPVAPMSSRLRSVRPSTVAAVSGTVTVSPFAGPPVTSTSACGGSFTPGFAHASCNDSAPLEHFGTPAEGLGVLAGGQDRSAGEAGLGVALLQDLGDPPLDGGFVGLRAGGGFPGAVRVAAALLVVAAALLAELAAGSGFPGAATPAAPPPVRPSTTAGNSEVGRCTIDRRALVVKPVVFAVIGGPPFIRFLHTRLEYPDRSRRRRKRGQLPSPAGNRFELQDIHRLLDRTNGGEQSACDPAMGSVKLLIFCFGEGSP
ncbi:hypothetical protein [Amycolatopsis sp. NPDC051061]|uniref:hypothetical protein n=1 Tax=Amycolatopsis sp. NPDC051061 TaxID=3155042 RepID=UPI0034281B91